MATSGIVAEQKIRILILEDNDDDVELIDRELKHARLSYTLKRVQNRTDLLKQMEEFSPDLVLSDYSIGKSFSGQDALLTVKQLNPVIPFILVTGTLPEETAIEIMKLGLSDYIIKDRLIRLPSAVLGALEKRREQEEKATIQERLRCSEEQFRLITENVRDLIAVINPNGHYSYLSPSFHSLVGDPDTLLGKSVVTNIHLEDRLFVERQLEQVMSVGEPTRFEFRVEAPDRTIHFLETQLNRMHNGLNSGGGSLVMVSRDITERKKAELKIVRQSEQLRRSNEELSQFAHVTSHDLKEPLRKIGICAEILEGSSQLMAPTEKEAVHKIVEGAHRMQHLIEDILEFSEVGREDQPLEMISCDKVLETAEANLEVQIHDNQCRILKKPLPVVCAQFRPLLQVFQNLITNAIKFRSESSPELHVEANRIGDNWLFSFRDNGIGVEPKFHRKIFEMFIKLHSREKYPGSGVGLAICKKVIENFGGKIWVESRLGKGTTFYFTIPHSPDSKRDTNGP